MREDLVGYLCHALDSDEQKLVEERLAGSVELRQQLERIPTILLRSPVSRASQDAAGFTPRIEIIAGVDGIHTASTAYRADGVALSLPAVLPSTLPARADLLARLRSACRQPAAQAASR